MEVPFHKHGSSHHQLLVVDSASSPPTPETRGWGWRLQPSLQGQLPWCPEVEPQNRLVAVPRLWSWGTCEQRGDHFTFTPLDSLPWVGFRNWGQDQTWRQMLLLLSSLGSFQESELWARNCGHRPAAHEHGFPGGPLVKNLPARQETQEIPWRREWQPTPVFFPGKILCLVNYRPWGRKELDTLSDWHFDTWAL